RRERRYGGVDLLLLSTGHARTDDCHDRERDARDDDGSAAGVVESGKAVRAIHGNPPVLWHSAAGVPVGGDIAGPWKGKAMSRCREDGSVVVTAYGSAICG